MLGRVNHIAIAVPNLAAATASYRDVLGARVSPPQALPEHGVTVVFVELPNTKVELLEPLGEGSPIHGFLEKNPLGGQHHLCYEVPDIDEARTWFEGLGKRILGPTRIGAHGTPIFFLHPKDMMGQLTEIMETPRGGGH